MPLEVVALVDEWSRALFAPLCHQSPERSWAPGGEQLVLCQRCFGIYSGLALVLVARWIAGGMMRSRRSDAVHALMLLQIAFMASGVVPESGWQRTLSGALVGVALVHFLAMPARVPHGARALFGTTLALVFPPLIGVRAPGALGVALDLLALAGFAALCVLAILFVQRQFAARAHSQPARVTNQ